MSGRPLLVGPVTLSEASGPHGHRLDVQQENVSGVRPARLDAREARELRDVLTDWLISIGAIE